MKTVSLGIMVGAALTGTFRSTMGQANKQTVALGKALRDTDKRLGAIDAIRKHSAELQRLRQMAAQAGGASEGLAKNIEATEKELTKAKSAAEKYGISLDKLGDEEKRLNRDRAKVRTQQIGGRVGRGVGKALGVGAKVAGATLGAGVLAGGAALSFGQQYASNIEDLQNTASTLGMTTQAYQELQLAAQNAGIKQETFNNSLEKMVGNISEANATGKGGTADALKELGLSASKLSKLEPDQQMAKLADALNGVKNEGDKIRLAKDIFGAKAGGEMLKLLGTGGAQQLAHLREEVKKTGAVLSDQQIADGLKLDDSLDRADLAMQGLTNTLGAALVPAMTELIEKATAFAGKHGPEIQAIGQILGGTFTAVGSILGGVFTVIESIGKAVGETLGWIETKTGVITKVVDVVGALFGEPAAPDATRRAAGNPVIAGPSTPGAAMTARATVPAAAQINKSNAERTAIPKPSLSAAPVITNNTHAPITIVQQPGQDANALSAAVGRELDARDQRAARTQRGALHDGGLAPAF